MQPHEPEVEDARGRIGASGRNPEGYTFDVHYLPPDPDGGGMFTIQYTVIVTRQPEGKLLKLIGGIGSRWVNEFEAALNDGFFD